MKTLLAKGGVDVSMAEEVGVFPKGIRGVFILRANLKMYDGMIV